MAIATKTELVYHKGPWKGFEDVELATLEWVDWFNNQRLFGPLGFVPPAAYERSGLGTRAQAPTARTQ